MSFVPPGPACFKTLADSGQPCQPEVETERLHVPDEPALPVTDGGEKLRKLPWVPVEPGPVLKLMDIHSPHRLRRLWPRFAAGRSQKTRRSRRLCRLGVAAPGVALRSAPSRSSRIGSGGSWGQTDRAAPTEPVTCQTLRRRRSCCSST